MFALQIFIGLMGYAVMRRMGYFQLLTVWLLFRLVKQQLKGGFKEVSNVAAKTA